MHGSIHYGRRRQQEKKIRRYIVNADMCGGCNRSKSAGHCCCYPEPPVIPVEPPRDKEFELYIPYTGQQPRVKDWSGLHFLFDAPARYTGLWDRTVFGWNTGLSEAAFNYWPDYFPPKGFWIGDPADVGNLRDFITNEAVPIETVPRSAIIASITANKGPLVPLGTVINPSFVRGSIHLRATSPSSGANTFDGVPFSELPTRGLLDADGYLEVCNADGMLGAPAAIQNVGFTSVAVSGTQHIWLYEAKGAGVAIRCDPTRTLAGLNKYDVVVRWIQLRDGVSRSQAIVTFVEGARDAGLVDNATWTTVIFLQPLADGLGSLFGISGLYAPAGEKPMWQLAAEETGIRSISNPSRPFELYDPTDIAQVFVQCVTTENFVSTVKDPIGRLAGLQNFTLSQYCDENFGDMIGPVGTTKAQYAFDCVQCIFEHHGGSYSPEIPFAWWRYVSYDAGAGDTALFTGDIFAPPVPVTQLLKVNGFLHVRDQSGAWSNTGFVNQLVSIGAALGDTVPWSLFQENLNACYYMGLQQAFADCPLNGLNPLGGKLHNLGNYDCTAGVVTLNSGAELTGWAIGDVYGVVVGDPLPASIPTVFPPPLGNIPVGRQYFAAQNCGPTGTNPFLNGDANAPNATIFDGQWIIYDYETTAWIVLNAWPVNQFAPGGTIPIFGAAQGLSAAEAQWRSVCFWHVWVPGSMISAGITDIMTSKQWSTL